jgi:hypothetical protein
LSGTAKPGGVKFSYLTGSSGRQVPVIPRRDRPGPGNDDNVIAAAKLTFKWKMADNILFLGFHRLNLVNMQVKLQHPKFRVLFGFSIFLLAVAAHAIDSRLAHSLNIRVI